MDQEDLVIGFFGLGAMGSNMAANLAKAGLETLGWDLDAGARERHAAKGGRLEEPDEILARADVIVASLPSSEAFVHFCRESVLPTCRRGQIVLNTGTVSPPAIRSLAREFSEKGAFLVDAPVTGGVGGAERGQLRFFVSGDGDAIERVRPALEAMGDQDYLAPCGAAGAGQIVKGVNQLGMGLANAAMIEAVAFGVNAGVDATVLDQLVGGDQGWRRLLRHVCRQAESGQAANLGIKAGQYAHFLEEARERRFRLPIVEALEDFLRGKEACIQEANRRSPSYWKELVENRGGVAE